MPVLARLDGAVIAVYPNDHPPPHFHVSFAEHRACVDIESLTVMRGSLPISVKRQVLAWAETRREALLDRFLKAIAHERVEPVP